MARVCQSCTLVWEKVIRVYCKSDDAVSSSSEVRGICPPRKWRQQVLLDRFDQLFGLRITVKAFALLDGEKTCKCVVRWGYIAAQEAFAERVTR
ncbi:hypothetical protein M407DRAFT_176507 [Tulasnella calospora MUT 4182]|uniref:Uncharacterized protein n=1 Tax=Tulasnella calospora MUT 4182 TaxID=1051891 RepID=A0A0C3QM07_9AGAM|nr:hypothetical protein M407DRAFT_176507 [Tulasnella calospora MUT 4182]